MHPAEREMIFGALEQIEASVRTLRRYLSYSARMEAPRKVSINPAETDEDFYEAGDPDEKMEALLAQMMGGDNEPPKL